MIRYVWIISLIQTAVVIRCSSETRVAAVWMMWVLFIIGERVLLHVHNVWLTPTSPVQYCLMWAVNRIKAVGKQS
jgi:hypothetical protein